MIDTVLIVVFILCPGQRIDLDRKAALLEGLKAASKEAVIKANKTTEEQRNKLYELDISIIESLTRKKEER